MKILTITFLLLSALFCDVSFSNKQGDFLQTIVNDLGKKIVYSGEIFVDRENILWNYKTPIQKSILIRDDEVVITEPELYQVTVIRREEGINLTKIYKKSRKKSAHLRVVNVDNVDMTLYEEKDFISKITFQDKLDNNVTIEFKNVQTKKIDPAKFTVNFPKDFDVIYQ